jgi:hypothetical protein
MKKKPAPKEKKRSRATKPAARSKGAAPASKPAASKRVEKPEVKDAKAAAARPARRKRRGDTLDKKAAFLGAYSICASIRHAAKAAHVNPRRHYTWLRDDPDYVAGFKQAQIEAAHSLEDEASYRAMVGVFEPNVYQGRWLYPQEEYEIEPASRGKPAKTGYRDVPGSKPLGLWKKSDALLMFRLRGEYPEKYRPYGSMELTGPGGGPIEIVERLQAARARVLAAQPAAAEPSPNADDGTTYRN